MGHWQVSWSGSVAQQLGVPVEDAVRLASGDWLTLVIPRGTYPDPDAGIARGGYVDRRVADEQGPCGRHPETRRETVQNAVRRGLCAPACRRQSPDETRAPGHGAEQQVGEDTILVGDNRQLGALRVPLAQHGLDLRVRPAVAAATRRIQGTEHLHRLLQLLGRVRPIGGSPCTLSSACASIACTPLPIQSRTRAGSTCGAPEPPGCHRPRRPIPARFRAKCRRGRT